MTTQSHREFTCLCEEDSIQKPTDQDSDELRREGRERDQRRAPTTTYGRTGAAENDR
jgi:hypothetical protein